LSDNHGPAPNSSLKSTAGAYSLAEILSQPQCWTRCLAAIEGEQKIEAIRERFKGDREWLFVGCGSSYYLALAAAAAWSELGIKARAMPASELLAFPGTTWEEAMDGLVPVLISRSGRTSEVLGVAEVLHRKRIACIAVSCAAGQPLQELVTEAIIVPADEQSTVMTRSFTSMLLTLQHLAARLARKDDLGQAQAAFVATAERIFSHLPARVLDFVTQNRFADYVCLGQGTLYGIACESMLKVTEMSCSYAQSFHTLEFRHGPKSIVGPETLVTFLLSDSNYAAERDVLEEMKGLGASTLVVASRGDDRVRAACDFLIELSFGLPQFACAPSYAFAAQLLGLYTGLKKGLDPDRPRNLTRVVVLPDSAAPVRR
jgi:glutamine---fructose-6-phosphate transaminase (isomerizing)